MRKIVWTLRWDGLRPELSSDEWFRTTLVIPLPLASRVDEDGDRDWPAIVLAVAPWWATRLALAPDFRAWVRWHRAAWAAEYEVLHDEQAWDLVHAGFARIEPPSPRRM